MAVRRDRGVTPNDPRCHTFSSALIERSSLQPSPLLELGNITIDTFANIDPILLA